MSNTIDTLSYTYDTTYRVSIRQTQIKKTHCKQQCITSSSVVTCSVVTCLIELLMEKYRLVGERKSGLLPSSDDGRLNVNANVNANVDATIASGGEATTIAASGVGGGGVGGSSSEVRITQQGKPRNYISYAMTLLNEGSNEISLKAMGRAINKAVTIAEILKRKMPLHQVTLLSSSEIIDVFEPLEEGLDIVESKRYVSCITIKLSTTGAGMNFDDIGYQPPLPSDEIQPGDLNIRPGSEVTSPV